MTPVGELRALLVEINHERTISSERLARAFTALRTVEHVLDQVESHCTFHPDNTVSMELAQLDRLRSLFQ